MNISLFEVKGWEKSHIKRNLKGHKLQFFNNSIREEDLKKIKNTEVLCVFINSKVTKEIISKLPKLKLICTMSTGFDHIHLPTAKKRNIPVCSVPFYGENTVAEHTFGLILALSRNIHKAYLRTQEGNYSLNGLMGFDLKGKTLGIVGGGHIGMHVARMAKSFNMEVLVFDLHKDSFKEEIVGFEYADLDTIYKKSDVLTIHLPYNEHTHNIINKESFKKMKKGVLLINTARGGLVNTEDLIWALDKGIIGGAGLDVLEDEHYISEEKALLHDTEFQEHAKKVLLNHVLLDMKNVVYTPHIAFYSKEALVRILDTTVENISKFKENKLQNNVY